MKKNFRIATMAALSVMALSLGACSSADSGSQGTTDAASESSAASALEIHPAGNYNPLDRDQIKDGGELKLPLAEFPEQNNQFHGDANAYTRSLWIWYNPQIALFDGDGTWHANEDYIVNAKDEIVDGKTVLTWDIHPDATFNDGTPIDWTAFEATWKVSNGENPEIIPSSTDGYEQIESIVKGENDKQVVITFNSTYPWWQGLFNIIVHPSLNDANEFNNSYIKKLRPELGAGPFKVDRFDAQTGEVVFVRNEKWWGDTAKLEKVTFRQMEDQATINAFQAGEIDIAGVGTKDNLAKARALGDKVDIRAALLPASSLITLNSQAPNLKDIKVREAIVRGLDRSQIADIRFNGMDYTEALPGSLTFYPNQPAYEDNFGTVGEYNPEKAKQLLDEAGWAPGADGIREKDGQKLSIRYTLLGDSPLAKAFASAIQKMMKDIGIDLVIEERPSSDFSDVTNKRDFDLFFMGFSSSDPFGAAYFGQTWKSDSQLNRSATGTPEFDAKIEKLQKLPTAEEQIKEANKLEKEAFALYGLIPMYNGPQIVSSKKGLANLGAYSFAVVPREDIGWAK